METTQTQDFITAFHGGFSNMLRWHQLDALWDTLRQQADAAQQQQRMTPRQHDEQQRRRRRQRHLADIAGEVVGAERLQRPPAGEGMRDQRGRQRMLRAASEPAHRRSADS